jgi:hypothetical protein
MVYPKNFSDFLLKLLEKRSIVGKPTPIENLINSFDKALSITQVWAANKECFFGRFNFLKLAGCRAHTTADAHG